MLSLGSAIGSLAAAYGRLMAGSLGPGAGFEPAPTRSAERSAAELPRNEAEEGRERYPGAQVNAPSGVVVRYRAGTLLEAEILMRRAIQGVIRVVRASLGAESP